MSYLINVVVDNSNPSFDSVYSYFYSETIERGKRVLVPFGKSNILRKALVLNSSKLSEEEFSVFKSKKIKDIAKVLSGNKINQELMNLIEFVKDRTFSTYYDAVKLIIPKGIDGKFKTKIVIVNEFYKNLSLDSLEVEVINLIKQRKGELKNIEQTEYKKQISSLVKKSVIEFIKVYDDFKEAKNYEYDLSENYKDILREKKVTKRQEELIQLFIERGCLTYKDIYYYLQISRPVLEKLVKLGVCKKVNSSYLNIYRDKNEISKSYLLNQEQTNALNFLIDQFNFGKFSKNLLYGVTGSGKTVVYLKFIEYVIKNGKTAIFLVPEISLTPQVISTFKSYFGNCVGLFHSNLSATERVYTYNKIKDGNIKIIIGTRSCVFSQLENIGCIIVDEEQDSSYFSDKNPKYSTKDIALYRCKYHNCVLLLGSATPSVNTFYQCEKGYINLLKLTTRYSKENLPSTKIIDMKEEIKKGNTSILSNELVYELNKVVRENSQAIILINKRGYDKVLVCSKCLEVLKCKNCNVSMTYHKANDKLMCHHCGFIDSNNKKCEFCSHDKFLNFGFGTQKLEEEVLNSVKGSKILRMDFDTTYSKFSYQKNFSDFKNQNYNILIGTQMISKGLDFENVTLVGVLGVESILYQSGYKGHERLFSIISQVIGRSGRGSKNGKAIIQTTEVDNEVINLASLQDYDSFYNDEIKLRRALLYPPFCQICLISFKGLNEQVVFQSSNLFVKISTSKYNENYIDMPLKLMGPIPFNVVRVNNVYRYKIALKCVNNQTFRNFLKDVICEFTKLKDKNVKISIDFNNDIEV